MQYLVILFCISLCSRNFAGPPSTDFSSSRGTYAAPPGKNGKGKGKGKGNMGNKGKGNKGQGFSGFEYGANSQNGFGSKGKGKGTGKGKGGGNSSGEPRGRPGSSELGSWTSSGPEAAPLLGDVGFTTVSGGKLQEGEDIYGPFEAGFGQEQDFVLRRVGCRDPSKGYISGGIDTHISEKVMGAACGVDLPRKENGMWVGLLDECGGHTREYHFHERLACLYDVKNQKGGHSTQIGQGLDTQYLYGKWEDTNKLPLLDACGGHFGVTPDSNGESVYHYHVQFNAPFTFGCYGPNEDGTLVSVDQCRKLYSGCGDGDNTYLDTGKGKVEYDPWCPCYDANGSNVGTIPLPGLRLQNQHRLQLDTDSSYDWPFLSAFALFGIVFGFILTFTYKTSRYKRIDVDDHELISVK